MRKNAKLIISFEFSVTLVNAAIHGIASQSSDFDSNSPASNAIDGAVTGSFAITSNAIGIEKWFKIDLLTVYEVYYVRIYTNTRGLQVLSLRLGIEDRLNNIEFDTYIPRHISTYKDFIFGLTWARYFYIICSTNIQAAVKVSEVQVFVLQL